MTLGSLPQWLDVVIALAAIGISIWAAWQATHREEAKDLDGRLKRMREDINALRERQAAVDTQLQTMPGANAVHELAMSVGQLAGDLKGVVAKLDGMAQLVDRQERATSRLEDYMRETSRRSG